MDSSKYSAAKENGSITGIINNGGGSYTIGIKAFDPMTGDALADTQMALNLSDVQAQLAYYLAAAANLQSLIVDCEATQQT